jgi:hypothetical protein
MTVITTGGMTLRRVIMTDFSVDPQYFYYSMDVSISYKGQPFLCSNF